jgi:hypothetical protein
MSSARPLPFPPNPSYGAGACRRRIVLRQEGRQVHAMLDDVFHEMNCRVSHDGRVVTDISAETLRIPTSACPGAAAVLRELIGTPLDIAMSDLYGAGRPRRHCTHLFDLAALAIAHARRPEAVRRYDAIVPDSGDAPVTVEVWRDGKPVHVWQVKDEQIVAPGELAGRPLLFGFMAWAARRFHGDELEAASVLSKTWLISVGRRYQTGASAGMPVRMQTELLGLCHSYSPPQLDTAIFLAGNERDYSLGIPEK